MVGAGAAGLLAAAFAAGEGRRVVLLERTRDGGRSFEPLRMAAAESALTALRDAGGLSRNTADILERTLAG